ncbi:MAG: phospholipase [Candidatus Latescibacteria bacterium]|nr:phospholipase [Candidatus Latescibacterota bacterium]
MNRAILLAGLVLIAAVWALANAQTAAEPLPAVQLSKALETLPTRSGPMPTTSPGIPHVQRDQNAPIGMQKVLLEAVQSLPDVELWETRYSLPGSVGWLLPERLRQGPKNAFTPEGEFGHAHRSQDGSMHLRLPAAVGREVLKKGWGIWHPFSASITGGSDVSYLMIFGPRNEIELKAVWVIVQSSYALARGLALEDTPSTAIDPATGNPSKNSGSP